MREKNDVKCFKKLQSHSLSFKVRQWLFGLPYLCMRNKKNKEYDNKFFNVLGDW